MNSARLPADVQQTRPISPDAARNHPIVPKRCWKHPFAGKCYKGDPGKVGKCRVSKNGRYTRVLLGRQTVPAQLSFRATFVGLSFAYHPKMLGFLGKNFICPRKCDQKYMIAENAPCRVLGLPGRMQHQPGSLQPALSPSCLVS